MFSPVFIFLSFLIDIFLDLPEFFLEIVILKNISQQKKKQ